MYNGAHQGGQNGNPSQVMLTSRIYSLLVSEVTDLCYSNCLAHFSTGSTVLDVGIGNGLMLERWHQLIERKRISLVGIDTDDRYLAACRERVARLGLTTQVIVNTASASKFKPDRHFDYILFSMSFMLLDRPWETLKKTRGWLTPSGQVVFVHTMFGRRSKLVEFFKPKLKYLTTVDFGRVIYEDEFRAKLAESGFVIVTDRALMRTSFGGEYRMIIASGDQK